MAIVYRHIRLDKNEPFYIGIGKTENRAYIKRKRNNYWKHIVKSSPYEVQILFDDLTWDEACDKEIEFIKLYGRKDLGTGTLVNMTDGGDGRTNIVVSEETKQKISKSSLGRKFSDEHRQKISESNKGKILSEEQIKKMSESQKGEKSAWFGKKHSEETKQKIGESKIGKSRSNETKQKLREAFLGEKSPMYGKKLSEETKQKISESKKGRKQSEEAKQKMRESWAKRKKI
jgi:hypothetical protein